MAFFDGLNYQIEQAVVKTNMGFFQLQEKNYYQTTDSESPLVFKPELEEKLKQTTSILSYSPELLLDGNISTPEGSAPLIITGIIPELHKKFLAVSQNIIKGSFLSQESDGILIGEELAKEFKFNLGDQLVINYQDVSGELRSELLEIKGIYHFNSKIFEKRFVYINQQQWQKLFLKTTQKEILFHRVSLMTPSLLVDQEIQKLAKENKLYVKTWKNLNPEMAVVIDFHDGMINFFFIIIGLTITMTILTPVRMLWQERSKEMKMMTVLGISSKGLWKLGMFEVFLMILLSGLSASLILLIIIYIQSKTGLNFSSLNNGIPVERAGIELPAVVYPRPGIKQLMMTFGFVVFTMFFSYAWSIRSTIKKLDSAL